ncbi:MAG: hypothetical protein ACYSYL_21000, partial [Planctomycetota bacterium]
MAAVHLAVIIAEVPGVLDSSRSLVENNSSPSTGSLAVASPGIVLKLHRGPGYSLGLLTSVIYQ